MVILSKKILKLFSFYRIKKNKSGAALIENGLIASIIGTVLVSSLGGIENSLTTTFDSITNGLNGQVSNTASQQETQSTQQQAKAAKKAAKAEKKAAKKKD